MDEKNDLMKNIASSEDNNMKKYLIMGGGVFVLFVIGIVIAKFMFASPKNKNDTEVILPPEIKANQQQKKDTALFNDIPVENEFKKPQPTKVEKTQEKPSQVQKEIKVNKPTTTKKVEVKPIVKKEVKPKVEVAKIPVQKPIKKEVKKAVSNADYYIQVAAVTRGNPSKKFLNLIKKNGFSYKIVEVKLKGMNIKRVLVGGYSYKEVKKALPKVRAKISSSAFIKRLK